MAANFNSYKHLPEGKLNARAFTEIAAHLILAKERVEQGLSPKVEVTGSPFNIPTNMSKLDKLAPSALTPALNAMTDASAFFYTHLRSTNNDSVAAKLASVGTAAYGTAVGRITTMFSAIAIGNKNKVKSIPYALMDSAFTVVGQTMGKAKLIGATAVKQIADVFTSDDPRSGILTLLDKYAPGSELDAPLAALSPETAPKPKEAIPDKPTSSTAPPDEPQPGDADEPEEEATHTDLAEYMADAHPGERYYEVPFGNSKTGIYCAVQLNLEPSSVAGFESKKSGSTFAFESCIKLPSNKGYTIVYQAADGWNEISDLDLKAKIEDGKFIIHVASEDDEDEKTHSAPVKVPELDNQEKNLFDSITIGTILTHQSKKYLVMDKAINSSNYGQSIIKLGELIIHDNKNAAIASGSKKTNISTMIAVNAVNFNSTDYNHLVEVAANGHLVVQADAKYTPYNAPSESGSFYSNPAYKGDQIVGALAFTHGTIEAVLTCMDGGGDQVLYAIDPKLAANANDGFPLDQWNEFVYQKVGGPSSTMGVYGQPQSSQSVNSPQNKIKSPTEVIAKLKEGAVFYLKGKKYHVSTVASSYIQAKELLIAEGPNKNLSAAKEAFSIEALSGAVLIDSGPKEYYEALKEYPPDSQWKLQFFPDDKVTPYLVSCGGICAGVASHGKSLYLLVVSGGNNVSIQATPATVTTQNVIAGGEKIEDSFATWMIPFIKENFKDYVFDASPDTNPYAAVVNKTPLKSYDDIKVNDIIGYDGIASSKYQVISLNKSAEKLSIVDLKFYNDEPAMEDNDAVEIGWSYITNYAKFDGPPGTVLNYLGALTEFVSGGTTIKLLPVNKVFAYGTGVVVGLSGNGSMLYVLVQKASTLVWREAWEDFLGSDEASTENKSMMNEFLAQNVASFSGSYPKIPSQPKTTPQILTPTGGYKFNSEKEVLDSLAYPSVVQSPEGLRFFVTEVDDEEKTAKMVTIVIANGYPPVNPQFDVYYKDLVGYYVLPSNSVTTYEDALYYFNKNNAVIKYLDSDEVFTVNGGKDNVVGLISSMNGALALLKNNSSDTSYSYYSLTIYQLKGASDENIDNLKSMGELHASEFIAAVKLHTDQENGITVQNKPTPDELDQMLAAAKKVADKDTKAPAEKKTSVSEPFNSPKVRLFLDTAESSQFVKTKTKAASAGTNPNFVLKGPFGLKWFGKTSKDGDSMRLYAEKAAYNLLRMFTSRAIPTTVLNIDGEDTLVTPWVDDGGSPPSVENMTDEQKSQLLEQHAFDMFVGDHDRSSANMFMRADGSLLAHDLGQAFKYYCWGQPTSLDPNANPEGVAGLAMAKDLLKKWGTGQVQLSTATLTRFRQRIESIQLLDDSDVTEAIAEFMTKARGKAKGSGLGSKLNDDQRDKVVASILASKKNYLKKWSEALKSVKPGFEWQQDALPFTSALTPADLKMKVEHSVALSQVPSTGWQGKAIMAGGVSIENQEVMVKQVSENNAPATLIHFRLSYEATKAAALEFQSKSFSQPIEDDYSPKPLPFDGTGPGNMVHGVIIDAIKTVNSHIFAWFESKGGRTRQARWKAVVDKMTKALVAKETLLKYAESVKNKKPLVAYPDVPLAAVDALVKAYLPSLERAIDVYNNMAEWITKDGAKNRIIEPKQFLLTPEKKKAAVKEAPKHDYTIQYLSEYRYPKSVTGTTPPSPGTPKVITIDGEAKHTGGSVKQYALTVPSVPGLRIYFTPAEFGVAKSFWGQVWAMYPGPVSPETVAAVLGLFQNTTGVECRMSDEVDKQFLWLSKQAYLLQNADGKIKPQSDSGSGAVDSEYKSAINEYAGGNPATAVSKLQQFVASRLGISIEKLTSSPEYAKFDADSPDGSAGRLRVNRFGWDRERLQKELGMSTYVLHCNLAGDQLGLFNTITGNNGVISGLVEKSFIGGSIAGVSSATSDLSEGAAGVFCILREKKGTTKNCTRTFYFDIELMLQADSAIIGDLSKSYSTNELYAADAFGSATQTRWLTPDSWKSIMFYGGGCPGSSSKSQVNIRHGIDLRRYLHTAIVDGEEEREKIIKLIKTRWGDVTFAQGRKAEDVIVAK